MEQSTGAPQQVQLCTSTIYSNGKEVELTAYTINESNYFKLRDIATVFDFSVSWDGDSNKVIIDTSKPYAE